MVATAVTAVSLIKWFEEIGLEDIPAVGGKNASLGEMYRALSAKGVPVPDGFAITTDGYRLFSSSLALKGTGAEIRRAILETPLPYALESAILAAYARLGKGADASVAVRSSATAEDLPDASFAGQQESFLNVRGRAALLDTCRRCFASLYTDRAISYRADKGVDGSRIALSIGVQLMVRSDLASSGVMFTLDTETGFRDAVLINAAYGLGESIVQGAVNPDEYTVFKPALKDGFAPIVQKIVGSKELRVVYDEGGTKRTRSVPVPGPERERFALCDEDILTLARWACVIEEHYSAKKGAPCPMDIEWAKDGLTGKLYIVQARPETVQSRLSADVIETYRLERRGAVLAEGHSVGGKVACGRARVIRDASNLSLFQPGEVLVTDRTDPDWEPIMMKAAAIVTDRGGRTCHAAIVSRELGLPAVVGTETGTGAVRDGDEVTVSCAEGATGFVYAGRLPFAVDRVELKGLARPKTKIMLNAANPREAFGLSRIPNSGVGLARMEFIITNFIRIHPMALVHPERVLDPKDRAEIERATAGWDDKPAYFVDKLAEGAAMIAAAFHPKDVILRLSDFKTNEYAGLVGGAPFEPHEENPMIGFRGASRYAHPRYRDGFALECRAMLKVRETMGLKNLKLMVPFCRTVEEGRKVLAEMEKHGLKRGQDGLEVYVMCEIPSNVILADRFGDIFDGFSIGSNDLTQLILGVDRDSEIVAPLFDERDEAVKAMISQVIRAAKAKGRKIGICGQAPSDYPDFAEFLVAEGIDSISLNPDAVLKTTLAVLEMERKLGLK